MNYKNYKRACSYVYKVERRIIEQLERAGYLHIKACGVRVFLCLSQGIESQTEIAAELRITRQAIYERCQDLMKLDLIYMERDSDDRTRKFIRCTAAGDEVLFIVECALDVQP